MIAAAALLALACIEPSGTKVTAGDLSKAVPALASVPPDTVVGYAPQPGVARRITAAQLTAFSRGSLREADLPEALCVEWKMITPDAEVFRTAMQSALPPGSQLAILETSQFRTPPGPVRFPFSSLHGSVWRGFVEYTPGARFDVWARVAVRIPSQRVVAAQDIPAGTVLTESMLRQEETGLAPGPTSFVSTLADAVGRQLRRPLKQGTPLLSGVLDRRVEVRKGDTLQLRVRAGRASIGLQATALAPASTGDTIPVRVTETGRTVRVRIAGPGEASLQLSGGN